MITKFQIFESRSENKYESGQRDIDPYGEEIWEGKNIPIKDKLEKILADFNLNKLKFMEYSTASGNYKIYMLYHNDIWIPLHLRKYPLPISALRVAKFTSNNIDEIEYSLKVERGRKVERPNFTSDYKKSIWDFFNNEYNKGKDMMKANDPYGEEIWENIDHSDIDPYGEEDWIGEIERNPNDCVSWRGVPFWIGIIDARTKSILETWPFRVAQDADFHAEFYMGDNMDKVDSGEYLIFWANTPDDIEIDPAVIELPQDKYWEAVGKIKNQLD